MKLIPTSSALRTQASACCFSTPPEKVSQEPSEMIEIRRSLVPSWRYFKATLPISSSEGEGRESRPAANKTRCAQRNCGHGNDDVGFVLASVAARGAAP